MLNEKSEAETAFASLFEARRNDSARDVRERDWRAFLRGGLPNRRNESWHYTDLRGALRDWTPPQSPSLIEESPGLSSVALVCGEGDWSKAPPPSEHYAPAPGVARRSLSQALASLDENLLDALAPRIDDPVLALNGALMSDGVVLEIAPGAVIDEPIVIERRFSGAGFSVTRSLVVVGEGARVTIVERAPSADGVGGFENDALIFVLGPGAVVDHCALVGARSERTTSVLSLVASLDAKAALNSFGLVEGGGLMRRQIFARLTGEDASVGFNGVSLLRGKAFADTTLHVRHEAPNGKSRERFRTIVDGDATGVFQGKVSVAQAAQKTDGAMQSKCLLLSPGASMSNKPELEIFADDVLCGHGATCGRLEAEQLFYLMARGLPRAEAEALLIEGFANEAAESIAREGLRASVGERISAWLAGREGKR